MSELAYFQIQVFLAQAFVFVRIIPCGNSFQSGETIHTTTS
jgi:hypothetical protein